MNIDEPMPDGDPTYRGIVYPWHCDHMGHMNVMWYVAKFDEATWTLMARDVQLASMDRSEASSKASLPSR